MISGRARIISGEIAQKKLRGKALIDALDKGLNQSEAGSTYQNTNVKKNAKKK